MAIAKMHDDEIQRALADLNNELTTRWRIEAGKLHKEFKFANFVAAFGFMTQAAICAERMNHHPEWFNVYNRVTVDLTTHEANGITTRDFELAQQMETILGSPTKTPAAPTK